MSPDSWGVLATVLLSTFTIISIFYGWRRTAKKDLEERMRLHSAERAQSFEAGAKSRDGEVRGLVFERDDARADRDVARAEASEWRNRYLNLRDKGTGEGTR